MWATQVPIIAPLTPKTRNVARRGLLVSASRRDAGFQDAEAHLVGGALTPHDVPGSLLLSVDHGLLELGVVEAAGDTNDRPGRCLDRLPQDVDVLPVEVPARDVQEGQRVGPPGVELDPDVDAAQVHVTSDRIDRGRGVELTVAPAGRA